MARIHVIQVITALTTGGAESMLTQLVGGLDVDRFRTEVVALSGGPVKDQLEARGIAVTILGMPRGIPDPRGLWRLARLLRERRPEVVQTWLYHADLTAGLAARRAGWIPVAWGLHNTTLNAADTRRTTLWTRRLCAHYSWSLPQRIVCCSVAARQAHAELGYDDAKMVVIPNGFDLTRFQPDPAAQASLRAELELPPETPLVGLVARFDAQKDHANFLAAAARIQRVRPEVRFLLAGRGITAENETLAGWIAAAGVGAVCRLLGPRDDVPRLLAGIDVACSSSVGEAFPMVLGEAMACGTPCVATDVGDSALLVGATGRVVPPRDGEALADALLEVLALPATARHALGDAARARITAEFSLPRIIARYQDLWAELAATRVSREANGASRGTG